MTTEARPAAAEFSIKIDGYRVSPDFLNQISDVEVESSLNLPDVFTIKVHLDASGEKPFEVMDDMMKDYLNDGKEVEIASHANNRDKVILVGEITSVSLNLSGTIPGSPVYAIIQGYDKSHRLHRGRFSKTYINTSYSDIAKKIAGAAGLRPDVDSTSGVHDYVIQSNQTNWDFLWQMAKRVGYEVYVDGASLCFKDPTKGRPAPVELDWGNSLLQFRVRLSTASQVSEVTVRGWNPKEKKEIVGRATTGAGSPKLGDSRSGMDQAKSAFGESKVIVVDQPVYTQAEADNMARALADAMTGEYAVAEGSTARGMPEIRPRVPVKITGLGRRLSGEYYVTSATHRFSARDGYTTSFVVSGRQPYTILGLTESPDNHEAPPYGGGVVAGVVTNNQDPDDLGRVKIKFPWLGENIESDWAWVTAIGAGKDRGIQWLPEVDDTTLVAFEQGDINRPYVLGGLWNSVDTPATKNSEGVSGGKVNQRVIRSRSGHVIILDDSDGAEQIIIRDKTEKNELVINSAENTISISADQDINITAAGKVIVESTQDFTLKSSANLKIEASANIDIEAGANLTMKGGAQTSLEGSAQLSVKGGAQTAVESSGQLSLRGAVVNIN